MPNSDDFETILTTHLDDMYALAIRLTGSKDNAEDLVHDLFINLSVKRYQNREILQPRAWLASILYRIFIDQWRRKKRAPVQYWSCLGSDNRTYNGADNGSDNSYSSETHPQDNIVSLSPRPDEELEMDNKQKRLQLALDTLNERQQQIVVLHELEGYKLEEISHIMNMPLGTVKSSLYRAKDKLLAVLSNTECNKSGQTQHDDAKER